MSFISYAQNFEDVMLWRALKHVTPGFYIDIGAAWPDEDSVTKAFYSNGWRGINVEPNPKFHQLLNAKRPEDVNLRVAVGDCEGSVLMKVINDTGLSTVSESIGKSHEQSGLTVVEEEVPLTTLASLCKEYIDIGKAIHFLKVDVEGLEEAVLRGHDWSTYRPWIVVVEATLPMTQIECYEVWEPILLNANYKFVYADGLNRFYLDNEHPELMQAFNYPPNVFDGFTLVTQLEAESKAQQAEIKAQQAEIKAQQAEIKAHNLALQLQTIYNSRSWRITAPLRSLQLQLSLLQTHGIKSRANALVKKMLRKLLNFLLVLPLLKAFVAWVANLLGITDSLKRIVLNTQLQHQSSALHGSWHAATTKLAHLSPRSRRIYGRLKHAIESQKVSR